GSHSGPGHAMRYWRSTTSACERRGRGGGGGRRGRALFVVGTSTPPPPARRDLAALLSKGRSLGGSDDPFKERFRRLQLDGEDRLGGAAIAGASATTPESLVPRRPPPWPGGAAG